MAIADRINEMYTHVGDVYDTITNVDLPTNKNIQNIPQTIKDSYLEIMNNGIDTIWNNWEKVTGSGTSISLSPTLKAPMKNELKGNTSQTGTPTPTSPIPVNVVSGDNQIEIYSKNLFDKNSPNLVNGYLGANGSITTNNSYRVSDYIYIGNYSNITISGNNENGLVYCFYKEDKTFNGANAINGTSKTITPPTDTAYIRVTVKANNLDNYMVESGSTTSTYEPYQGNTYNIDLPVENLFELPATQTINGITFTNNGNGTFNLSGTASANTNFVISKNINTIANGSYTMSSKSLGYSLQLAFYNGSTWLSTPLNKIRIELTKSANVTIPINATSYNLIITIINGDTLNLSNETIQLEKGSKQNDFTPYGTTPIELCKIGNYQDYFYKENGKWHLHKEIGKIASYNGETITTDYISTTGQLTTGATVYYVLATPTDTEITYQPLIDQLNELEKAISYEGQTNISQVNNDLPFIISASALKKG